MAFFYVRDHPDGVGNATGDGGRYTTIKTGDWDAALPSVTGYYVSVDAAEGATTPPVAGDVIIVSNIHIHVYIVSTSYSGGLGGGVIKIFSVNDTAIDQPLAGAAESVTVGSSNDFSFSGRRYIFGMSLKAVDKVQVITVNSNVIFEECTFSVTHNDPALRVGGDGCWVWLINCILSTTSTSTGVVDVSQGCHLEIIGGTMSGSTDSIVDGFASGGGSFNARGVDMSGVNAVGASLYSGGAGTGTDIADILIENCQINANLTINPNDIANNGVRIRAYNIAATSAAADHQFYDKSRGGVAIDATNIFRNESDVFNESAVKVSVRVDTSPFAEQLQPFVFTLLADFINLSNVSTDVVELYFATTSVLNDLNFTAKMVYRNGTTKNVPIVVKKQNANQLNGTAVNHTDDSGASTWKDGASDLTGHNEYRLSLDTSGTPGAEMVVEVEISVGIPSATIYIDTDLGAVAA